LNNFNVLGSLGLVAFVIGWLLFVIFSEYGNE
jgi:hypothetical protein